MNVHSGKAYLSEIVNALYETNEYTHYFIHLPSGRIEPFNSYITHMVEENKLTSDKIFMSKKGDMALFEFINSPQTFMEIPGLLSIGIETRMKRFILDNAPQIIIKKLKKNMNQEKFLELFMNYIEEYDMYEKWHYIEEDFLMEYFRKWCEKNNIDYIDDLSDDFVNNLENTTYVFSVSYCPGCYRHIKISSRATLFDLHEAIIESFDFDDDHAHAFFMNNKAWDSSMEYSIPEVSDCPRHTNDTYLSVFNFSKGDKFLYIFDFGDEWRFSVKFLRKIDEVCNTTEIIKCVGEAPIQYPDYDDEDF